MSEYKQYKRRQVKFTEIRPYVDGEVLPSNVSISETDRLNGSPRVGDMIARNPLDNSDQWLISAAYFADNYEPV